MVTLSFDVKQLIRSWSRLSLIQKGGGGGQRDKKYGKLDFPIGKHNLFNDDLSRTDYTLNTF